MSDNTDGIDPPEYDGVLVPCEIVRETDRAFQVSQGDRLAWVPKSLVSRCEYAGRPALSMPGWAATERDLEWDTP